MATRGMDVQGGRLAAPAAFAAGRDPEGDQAAGYTKTLEWRRQVAAKYNNYIRQSKSPAPAAAPAKAKHLTKSISSPNVRRKNTVRERELL